MGAATTTPPPRRDDTAVAPLGGIVEALGPKFCACVVIIIASLLSLLKPKPMFCPPPRPTRDVDAVTATRTYPEKAMPEERLRARGFKNAMAATHMDRWHAPDGTLFDLVACGSHAGGTGNTYDEWVITNAIESSLPPTIRHASGVGLLLLKCAACRDRGAMAPAASKDLADIAALIATRPGLEMELRGAPEEIRLFVGAEIAKMLTPRTVSATRAHIDDREPLIAGVADTVIEQLKAMSLVA